MLKFPYSVFLSYNRADRAVARRVARRLVEANIDVWFDEWEVHAGESLTDRVAAGISTTNAFLVIASRHSMAAPWVREELRSALSRRLRDPDFRIITIRTEPCELHPLLTDYAWLDYKSLGLKGVVAKVVASVLQLPLTPQAAGAGSRMLVNRLKYAAQFYPVDVGWGATVTEHYDIIAAEELRVITKHLYWSGDSLEMRAECDECEISTHVVETTDSMRRVEVRWDEPLVKNQRCQFRFVHAVADQFDPDHFIYYNVESPTRLLMFDFAFARGLEVSEARAYRREGQAETQLETWRLPRHVAYNVPRPSLHHSYVFRWEWRLTEAS